MAAAAGGENGDLAAHNRLLANDPAPGPSRRAAFAADQIAEGGASAVGMLVGGAIIGWAGVPATLSGAGLLVIPVTLTTIGLRPVVGRGASRDSLSLVSPVLAAAGREPSKQHRR
ncbi:hypothetical protein [Mobilicoccus massiliensis]|uniref:hypothetical protein n=1 Tax=Mobilicoccus massiliensis TaxID=1522310 RepID=UPI00058FA65E|nr:hypothetical protein [Mobilicoccus massiliensis]